MAEYAEHWQADGYDGLSLLKAQFSSFSFSRHWHDELAIGVIEQGAEGVDYRGSRTIVPEKQIVAINPGEMHTGYAGGATGWRYRMFYFPIELLKQVTGVRNGLGSEPSVSAELVLDDPELYQQLLQLHQAMESGLDLSKDVMLNQALRMLMDRHSDSPLDETWVHKDSKKAELVRDYFHQHWQTNIRLETLSVLTGLSDYQVIRYFRARFGATPHQYLIMLKLNHARRLLLAGLRPAEAAADCGFSDQSHLHRNFKKAFGVTPGACC